LLLLFGVTHKSKIDIDELWSIGSPNHMDLASACMARERFGLICSKLTLDNHSTRYERLNDKIGKVREIMTLVIRVLDLIKFEFS